MNLLLSLLFAQDYRGWNRTVVKLKQKISETHLMSNQWNEKIWQQIVRYEIKDMFTYFLKPKWRSRKMLNKSFEKFSTNISERKTKLKLDKTSLLQMLDNLLAHACWLWRVQTFKWWWIKIENIFVHPYFRNLNLSHT